MVSITQNRARHCKSQLGGVEAVYIGAYRSISLSAIDYDGTSITDFPETPVFKFEAAPGSAFEQPHTENEGGKYHDQRISLTFNKITVFDNVQFQRFLKKDLFLIVEDYNGNFFLMGFRNGVTADKVDTTTTQYKIDFSAQEERFAPFVNDVMGTGFVVVDGYDFIFQDDTNYIFQNDDNYIFQ